MTPHVAFLWASLHTVEELLRTNLKHLAPISKWLPPGSASRRHCHPVTDPRPPREKESRATSRYSWAHRNPHAPRQSATAPAQRPNPTTISLLPMRICTARGTRAHAKKPSRAMTRTGIAASVRVGITRSGITAHPEAPRRRARGAATMTPALTDPNPNQNALREEDVEAAARLEPGRPDPGTRASRAGQGRPSLA